MHELRLSNKRENSIMLPKTNRNNLVQYRAVLQHFYYDWKTERRVWDTLNHMKRPWKEGYLDKYFGLNSQRRAFFKLPVKAEYDTAYKLYCKIINRIQDKCLLFDANDNYKPVWQNPEQRKIISNNPSLVSYDTFISNKLDLPNGTSVKLFKFLIKSDFITRDEAESITTRKAGMDNLYFCLSRNPVDYLFSSTGQPFTSCISLDSTYEEAAFMGLGSLCLDPNRILMMVTKGKVKNRNIKGHQFRYLRTVSRSWGIMYSNKRLLIVGVYPHSSVPYMDVMSDIGFPAIQDYPKKATSQFHWLPPRYENDRYSIIYLDGGSPLHLHTHKDKQGKKLCDTWRYDTHSGRTGVWHSWNCGMNFEDIHDIEDLEYGSICCCDCGESINEDYAQYVDGDSYCESCFDDNYILCYSCGEPVYKDDAHFVDDEHDICTRCYNDYYFECEGCNESFHNDNLVRTDDDYSLCSYCADEDAFKCNDCGSIYYTEDRMRSTSTGRVCSYCYDDNYSECDNCLCIFLVEHDTSETECSDCRDIREEAVNE